MSWGNRVYKNVIHEPNLRTVLMVEKAIKNSKTYPTKKELWESLPKKIQYQTLTRIIEYLECSNKILLNKRSIVWIAADNQKLTNLLNESVVLH